MFKEVNILKPEILGNNNCQFFLSVDFYDHEIQNTHIISNSAQAFNAKILFVVKNDIHFKNYLKNGKLKVQLVKIKGINTIPIGNAELSLKCHAECPGVSFSLLKFKSFDKNIEFAEVKLEFGIYLPFIN